MLSPIADIHWLAILAGTVGFAALGGVYFAALFPKQYLYVTGREHLPKEQQAVSGAIYIVGPLVCSLMITIADAYLIRALGIGTTGAAALVGLTVGLGFLVPMAFTIAINPLFRRPIPYGLLTAPYFLIANVLACVLQAAIPF